MRCGILGATRRKVPRSRSAQSVCSGMWHALEVPAAVVRVSRVCRRFQQIMALSAAICNFGTKRVSVIPVAD